MGSRRGCWVGGRPFVYDHSRVRDRQAGGKTRPVPPETVVGHCAVHISGVGVATWGIVTRRRIEKHELSARILLSPACYLNSVSIRGSAPIQTRQAAAVGRGGRRGTHCTSTCSRRVAAGRTCSHRQTRAGWCAHERQITDTGADTLTRSAREAHEHIYAYAYSYAYAPAHALAR